METRLDTVELPHSARRIFSELTVCDAQDYLSLVLYFRYKHRHSYNNKQYGDLVYVRFTQGIPINYITRTMCQINAMLGMHLPRWFIVLLLSCSVL